MTIDKTKEIRWCLPKEFADWMEQDLWYYMQYEASISIGHIIYTAWLFRDSNYVDQLIELGKELEKWKNKDCNV
jgi:hypothetical protein